MTQCSCGHEVHPSAPYCPSCGCPEPGGNNAAPLLMVLFVVLFMTPAALIFLPFSYSLWNAYETAFQSGWIWIGSAMFWGIVIYLYINRKNDQLTNSFHLVISKPANLSMKYSLLGLWLIVLWIIPESRTFPWAFVSWLGGIVSILYWIYIGFFLLCLFIVITEDSDPSTETTNQEMLLLGGSMLLAVWLLVFCDLEPEKWEYDYEDSVYVEVIQKNGLI